MEFQTLDGIRLENFAICDDCCATFKFDLRRFLGRLKASTLTPFYLEESFLVF